MANSLNVAVVGATGTTGSAIIAGLLGSSETLFVHSVYSVRALARTSVDKPAYKELERRGVKVIPVDLKGSENNLVRALSGVDVVISALVFTGSDSEIPLANAAKAAGVKRFLQSAMMVVIPPRGVVDLREQKEEILNHIQKICLPYTYLDAGWWYDISVPSPPSRISKDQDGAVMQAQLGADGNVPIALAEIGDIDRLKAIRGLVVNQLFYSITIRGDNTPDNAKYLGYLDGKELYPDFEYTTVEDWVKARG
ncbi:uncharacterized protein LA080_008983 [Diaporthe eres]|nr:uncharacterized protein LA080_008983 [Diaporthe eres]